MIYNPYKSLELIMKGSEVKIQLERDLTVGGWYVGVRKDAVIKLHNNQLTKKHLHFVLSSLHSTISSQHNITFIKIDSAFSLKVPWGGHNFIHIAK